MGTTSATITLIVYRHLHPDMSGQAADRSAAPLEG
jgi:hypothetical protein